MPEPRLNARLEGGGGVDSGESSINLTKTLNNNPNNHFPTTPMGGRENQPGQVKLRVGGEGGGRLSLKSALNDPCIVTL